MQGMSEPFGFCIFDGLAIPGVDQFKGAEAGNAKSSICSMGRVKVHALHLRGFSISDAHVFGNHSTPLFNCTWVASIWTEAGYPSGVDVRPQTGSQARLQQPARHTPPQYDLPPLTISSLLHACTDPVHGPFGQVRATRPASYCGDEASQASDIHIGSTCLRRSGGACRMILWPDPGIGTTHDLSSGQQHFDPQKRIRRRCCRLRAKRFGGRHRTRSCRTVGDRA